MSVTATKIDHGTLLASTSFNTASLTPRAMAWCVDMGASADAGP